MVKKGFKIAPGVYENVLIANHMPTDEFQPSALPEDLQLSCSAETARTVMSLPGLIDALMQSRLIKGTEASVVARSYQTVLPTISLLTPKDCKVEIVSSSSDSADCAATAPAPDSQQSTGGPNHPLQPRAGTGEVAAWGEQQQQQQQQQTFDDDTGMLPRATQ